MKHQNLKVKTNKKVKQKILKSNLLKDKIQESKIENQRKMNSLNLRVRIKLKK